MISTETRENIRSWRSIIQMRLDELCQRRKAGFTMKITNYMVRQNWYGDDQQLEEWMYFVVAPGEGQKRAFEFSEALAEAETSLRRKGLMGNNVSVTSMLPMD